MTGRDWNASGAHVVGLFLNGEGLAAPGPQGERVEDDSFLLLFNASPDDCTFTIPSRRFGAAWTFVLSTADPDRPPGDETHKWHVEDHADVALVHAPAPRGVTWRRSAPPTACSSARR